MSLDVLEQMRSAFRPEALDLLIELDSALLALEAEPGDATLVHRVFRAIHTIKGSGATAGFTHLAGFAHKMEEAFDLAREGRLAVSPELIDCGLKACDVIRLILNEPAEGATIPGEAEAAGAFTRLLPASANPDPKPAGNSIKFFHRKNASITSTGIRPASQSGGSRIRRPGYSKSCG